MKVLVLALLPAIALGQLAGGITDTTVSEDYEPVQFAIKAVNTAMASSLTGGHTLNLVEIVHARTQVVAGEKLYLTLHMTDDYYCEVNVWYRSWLHNDDRMIITDGPTCTKHQVQPRAGPIAGGVSDPMALPDEGDTSQSSVWEALKFAACHMNDRINYMYASVLGQTSGITYTQQVTSGMTYRFMNVPMVATHCQNQGCEGLDTDRCHANAHGQTLTCSFTVQYQAWMNPKDHLTDVHCN